MYSDYYSYDLETYINCFTCRVKRDSDGVEWAFEISEWKDEGFDLFVFVQQVNASGAAMVGYNNVKFDYPVLHMLMEHKGAISCRRIYQKAQVIIQDGNRGMQWNHVIWDRDRYCPQIDLMMIHHFDNKAKMTSLKLLEFNMRMGDIQELPYDPHTNLTQPQAIKLMSYNGHDVEATHQFLQHTKSMLTPRYELSKQYGIDFTNFNDTKMGERITIEILKKKGVHLKKGDKTVRTRIPVADILFDYIEFKRPEFQEVHQFFKEAVINPENIKGFFGSLNCVVDGFQFDFGAGGIHGSRTNTIVRTGNGRKLRDSDVASYYPNIGIKNKVAPEHIGEPWCEAMDWMFHERLRVGKKTVEGNGYKLALNGSYGKSNDEHSVLCDPQYTMTITINGQLLLCMLAETLIECVPEFEMVQINTDGLTYTYPEEYESQVDEICKWWEALTQLELEHVDYRLMAIRDVNNYLAVTMPYKDKEGKLNPGYVKRIGAYAYKRAEEDSATRELPWHKNHSAIVVAKAAEAALVRNVNIESFIRNHVTVDPFDFYLRAKVPRSSQVYLETPEMWGDKVVNVRKEQIPNITRYYVSNTGGKIMKEMPPTEKKKETWLSKPHWRHKVTGEHKQAAKAPSGMWLQCEPPSKEPPLVRTGITSNYFVTVANTLHNGPDLNDVNIDYYVTETRKLVDKLIQGS